MISSVRDPNFISPNFSPARIRSPTEQRQTMRRAIIPAICLTTIVRSPSLIPTVLFSFTSDEISFMAFLKDPLR